MPAREHVVNAISYIRYGPTPGQVMRNIIACDRRWAIAAEPVRVCRPRTVPRGQAGPCRAVGERRFDRDRYGLPRCRRLPCPGDPDDILLSKGLQTESFLDSGNQKTFPDAAGSSGRYPDRTGGAGSGMGSHAGLSNFQRGPRATGRPRSWRNGSREKGEGQRLLPRATPTNPTATSPTITVASA